MSRFHTDDVFGQGGRNGRRLGVDRKKLFTMIGGAVAFIILIGACWFWWGWRIEVEKGEFVMLVSKTGDDLTNEDVVAPDPNHKGPQRAILREGRHFRNPFFYDWSKPQPATDIPKLHIGVKIRRWGKNPEMDSQGFGRTMVLATDDKTKGIVERTIGQGRHYINMWEYDIEVYPMKTIRQGYRGIVTRLVGPDPEDPFAWVVKKGERGVQPFLLGPGTHPEYSNPYVYRITSIDVRSHKFPLKLSFPSSFGFNIDVMGTIEWTPILEKLPETFVQYVDTEDIDTSGGINNFQNKIILPSVRGYLRLVGSRYRAVAFMLGSTRAKVQRAVETMLSEECSKNGIEIRSFVINDAQPPAEIRDQFARREMARREMDKFEEMIQMEIGTPVIEGGIAKLDEQGDPVLDEYGKPVVEGGTPQLDESGEIVRNGGRIAQVIEQRRKNRAEQLGEVRARIATLIRNAEEFEKVEVTKAEQERELARIRLEAAEDNAQAVRARGLAEADVVLMQRQAEAEGIQAEVNAYGSGQAFAENAFIKKFAPGINDIWSNTDGFVADLFMRFTADPAAE